MIFENKPKWEELPPRAKWIAMDEDGTWGWFATKPRRAKNGKFWYRGTEGDTLYGRPRTPSLNWVKSLEKRPK